MSSSSCKSVRCFFQLGQLAPALLLVFSLLAVPLMAQRQVRAAITLPEHPSPVAVTLPARRHAHVLVVSGVYINAQGPLRLLVDTGAASCSLRPEVAKRLGLSPKFRIERVTAAGSSAVPASLATLSLLSPAGETLQEEEVEFLFTAGLIPGVDGVLGQSFLKRHDYLLDYRNSRVVFGGEAPKSAQLLPLLDEEGRPALSVNVDGQPQALVVDSGAALLVLFRPKLQFSGLAKLVTPGGAIPAGLGEANVTWLPGQRPFRLPAAEVAQPRRSGLFPTSSLEWVYISNRQGLLALAPR